MVLELACQQPDLAVVCSMVYSFYKLLRLPRKQKGEKTADEAEIIQITGDIFMDFIYTLLVDNPVAKFFWDLFMKVFPPVFYYGCPNSKKAEKLQMKQKLYR